MTKKEIEKFLANTKVYVAGKSKEIQEKLFSFGYKWGNEDEKVDCTEAPFLFIHPNRAFLKGSNMVYFSEHENREITAEEILSLEMTESTYRPFKNVTECWQEMLKHQPFGWIKYKTSGSFYHLGYIQNLGSRFKVSLSTNENKFFESSFVYENYTFADGTPFGIKEE